MRKLKFILIGVFLQLLVNSTVAAPNLISYQGELNDDGGLPVNANISFVFSIYDVQTGGDSLWSEPQDIDVVNGVFDVRLGVVTPVPAHLFNNPELYLGIKASTDDEMTPRQRLTGSAYSQRVGMQVPIGSIISWHKSATGTPALEDGWVECNGQVLADSGSPYDGLTIPDLNGMTGLARYLKGNTISGTKGGSQTHSHRWLYDIDAGWQKTVMDHGGDTQGSGTSFDENGNRRDMFPNSNYSRPVNDLYTEKVITDPPYFEVVWIIRVK